MSIYGVQSKLTMALKDAEVAKESENISRRSLDECRREFNAAKVQCYASADCVRECRGITHAC